MSKDSRAQWDEISSHAITLTSHISSMLGETRRTGAEGEECTASLDGERHLLGPQTGCYDDVAK